MSPILCNEKSIQISIYRSGDELMLNEELALKSQSEHSEMERGVWGKQSCLVNIIQSSQAWLTVFIFTQSSAGTVKDSHLPEGKVSSSWVGNQISLCAGGDFYPAFGPSGVQSNSIASVYILSCSSQRPSASSTSLCWRDVDLNCALIKENLGRDVRYPSHWHIFRLEELCVVVNLRKIRGTLHFLIQHKSFEISVNHWCRWQLTAKKC